MARRADPLASGAVGGREGQFVLVEWSDPGGLTSRERPIAGLHVHHSDDEAWYVLEGTLGFRVGDDEVEAGPAPRCSCRGGRRTRSGTRVPGRRGTCS